jgi:hypothetical protein
MAKRESAKAGSGMSMDKASAKRGMGKIFMMLVFGF